MKEGFIWPIIILLGAICCYFNHHGIYLSDEYIYADNAWKIANGTFELSNSAFTNRFGFLLPMAGLIKLFGTSSYVLTLWTSLCFGFLLIANYFILHPTQKRIALLSTLLLALNPTLLYYAADVSHDLAMTAFLSIAILVLWQIQRQPNHQSIFKSVLFVGSLIWAFLTKMTVIYAAPFVLMLFLIDFFRNRNKTFWICSTGLGFVFLLGYLFAYYQYTGDAFFRFAGIEGEYNIDKYGYFNKSWKEVLGRITALPVAFILNTSGLGPIGLIALLGLFSKNQFNHQNQSSLFSRFKSIDLAKPFNFFGIYAISLLLLFWFGSTSLAFYNPIILADRMWMPLIPPISILAALVLSKDDFHYPNWVKLIVLMLSIGLSIASYSFRMQLPYLWMSLLIVVSISVVMYRKTWHSKLLYALLALFMINQLYAFTTHKKNTAYFYEKEYIENFDPQKEHILLVDKRFLEMSNAHFEWSMPKNIQLKEATLPNLSNLDSTKTNHIIINEFRKRHISSPKELTSFIISNETQPKVTNQFVAIYEIE